MATFPLYEQLLTKASPPINGKQLCMDLSNLKEEHYEYVYALILHHYLIVSNGKQQKLPPYDAKIMNHANKRGLQFFIESLPDDLLRVLNAYVSSVAS